MLTGTAEDDACLDPDDVVALLQARLEPASLHALEQHVAACSKCRVLLSALAQSAAVAADSGAKPGNPDNGNDLALAATVPLGELPRELAAGARLGRYVVERMLGVGAMGAVYAAHDPELDRKVALKILRAWGLGDRERELVREGMSREAQAMAQLAHPNVVAVHDVGTVGDHIFIAMELVDGQTLAAWLAAAPRSWRAVVAMFLAAGQGLAAAHTAGMVHRDFKPENVLVGHDGRARVGDFGLARMAVSDDPQSRDSAPFEWARGSGSTMGSLVGTPYYMAPEQLLCQPTDARSDQFTFCVALYAAIVRQHPFAGEGFEGMTDAVIEGRLRPPPPRSVLPRWILRVLQRGLSCEPGDRYPSMDALLVALGRDPRRRRVRTAAGGAAVLALAGSALLVAQRGNPQLCQGAERKWDGIWDGPRAMVVARAFSATGKPYAAATYSTVGRALGAYRTRWTAMHTEACEATRVRGDQTEALLERRMLCLDARLRDVRAVVDRFATADAGTVEQAPIAVGSMGDLASCADAQALSSQVPPPADLVTRARVAQLRTELAALKAERPTGRARARIAALVAASTATRYRPLEAEALLEQGAVATSAGDYAAAAQAYERAVWEAEAGRDDELAARAWTRLMDVRRSQARYDEALGLAPRVTVLLERLGGNDELEGNLQTASAGILASVDRFDEALAAAEKARALLERRFGADDLHVADALDQLANVARLAGRIDDALVYVRRELAILQRVYGDDHPAVAAALDMLAFLESMKSHYQEALVLLAKAQSIYERTVDANHPALGKLAHGFGINYMALAQFDKAVAMFRRATSIAAVAQGKDHPNYAAFMMDLGDALGALGRHGEALSTLREALGLLEKSLGPEHSRLAILHEYIANELFQQGRYQEARTAVARAISIYEKRFGPQSANLRQALLASGRIEVALGSQTHAIAALERAYAFGPNTDPGVYAEIEWLLGRALVDTHRDTTRGMKLVRSAMAEAEKDVRNAEIEQEAVRWVRKHH